MTKTKVQRIEGKTMPVNSYLVEAPDGVVVIDGMLTVSDARRVGAELDRIGKPVLGAIVTHAHPDHYAGLAEMLAARRDTPIFAIAAVRRAIERDDAVKNQIVGPMMKEEWPQVRVFPGVDVVPGETLRLGSLSFDVVDLGPGESPADSLYRLSERDWFVGDLVYSRMHAYLADGFAAEWMACLDRLERELVPATVIYPGHGAPGDGALIATQREYVRAFTESVQRHLSADPAPRQAAVVADMKAILPTEELAFLMELSVEPYAAKLGRGTAARRSTT
jgi:glyoxylase-like metal-dependent hydrolase (beta-lactamase superfamily II)